MKRQPILADRIAWGSGAVLHALATSRWVDHTVETLQVAKKFVFDTQATQYLAQMVRENPRIIADAQDFAIQPFDKMWVEMPFETYFEVLTNKPSTGSDAVIGYLFEGPVVKVCVAGTADEKERVSLLPFEYVLHRPMRAREEIELAERLGMSRLMLDLWFWGSTAEAFTGKNVLRPDEDLSEQRKEWDKAGLRALRANHTVRVPQLIVEPPVENWASLAEGSAGDLRTIIGLLLFLNRTHDLQVKDDVRSGQGMHGNKLRPFVAHSVIRLRLDPTPRLRKLSAGAGIRHRLHDVRGHFCHDKQARAGCAHGEERQGDFGEFWEEYKPLHWRCSRCAGLRWWRKEHSRGHLEEGMVIQQYEVTR